MLIDETIANAPGGQQTVPTGTEKYPLDAATGNPNTDGKYILGSTLLNSSPVLSTGSSVARGLATRFSEVFNVKDYGAVGNGIADDTAAIQAAIHAASQTNGTRGGTVFIPSGKYSITSTLIITEQGNVCLLGAGPISDGVYSGAISSSYQWGASELHYSGTAGTGCIKIQSSDQGTKYATIGVRLQNFAIALPTGVDGVVISGGTGYQYDIWFNQLAIMGGRRQIYVTGTSDCFNIHLDELELNINGITGVSPQHNIYSDATAGLNVECSFRKVRALRATVNHIYLGGSFFNIELDSCTFESCGLQSISIPNSGGQINIHDTHWEDIGQNGYWNGTNFQVSNVDTTALGIIQIGSVSAGNTNSIFSLRDCDINCSVSGNTGSDDHILSPIVVFDSSKIKIEQNRIFNGGTFFGQPIVRRDGFGTFVDIDINTFNLSAAGVSIVDGAASTPGNVYIKPSSPYSATAYSASITPSAYDANYHVITVSDASAFTINALSNPPGNGQFITFRIVNGHGAPLGTLTWNANYHLGGAWTQPAASQSRFITFVYGPSGICLEVSRSAVDVPN